MYAIACSLYPNHWKIGSEPMAEANDSVHLTQLRTSWRSHHHPRTTKRNQGNQTPASRSRPQAHSLPHIATLSSEPRPTSLNIERS